MSILTVGQEPKVGSSAKENVKYTVVIKASLKEFLVKFVGNRPTITREHLETQTMEATFSVTRTQIIIKILTECALLNQRVLVLWKPTNRGDQVVEGSIGT